MTHDQAPNTDHLLDAQPDIERSSARWARTGDGRWFTPGDPFTARAHIARDGLLTITHDCVAGPITHNLTGTGTACEASADGSATTGLRLHTSQTNSEATYVDCTDCGYNQTLNHALAATNDPLNPTITLDMLRRAADEHTYLTDTLNLDSLSHVDAAANCTCGNFRTYGTDPARTTAAFIRHVLAEALFETGHPHTTWNRL